MNRQPFESPPRWWEPKLSPRWVKLTRGYRWRQLRRGQKLVSVEAHGLEYVRSAVKQGKGVLIAPNHSAHFDSAALYVALDKINQPVFFMAAWQVFGMSNRFERWFMQRLGCFSIDRESTDRQAFKQAVHSVQHEKHPLVIFPEGDIYHVSDHVTKFREGAAAIALSAAKRSKRPIVVIPCGIKFWYVEDPTEQLLELVEQLEERLLLRNRTEMPLPDRIYRLSEAVLSLKELDYLGQARTGTVQERIAHLAEFIVSRLEQQYRVKATDNTIPERVKNVRQCIIREAEQFTPSETDGAEPQLQKCERDMDDLFFVVQLYSYPGDYLRDDPSIERIAETLDKFEEDILGVELPSVRGRRKVSVRFGEPIPVASGTDKRRTSAELTEAMQASVQKILDSFNGKSTH